ncbi:MAG: copper resistance protein [Alphaproteobacteria bacterium]|jgi:methionine-rich copper-binding protein CopC|nr:copper resistance protein [Alphaproteobacteria bacterium]
MATRLHRVGPFVLAAFATLLVNGAALSATSQTVSTDPDANATVKAPLEMIHVLFHDPVDMKTARMSVTDKNGKPVDVGQAMQMGTDGKLLMAMPKTPLPAGTYHVKWQVKGANGTPLQGEFTFTAK